MAKQTVTVELLGTEKERTEFSHCSDWKVSCGDKTATIKHLHSSDLRQVVDAVWYVVSVGPRVRDVHDRDFTAALTVAKRMLGVKS